MPKYTVSVDDNFHFMDESERYTLGEFDTYEAAVDACKTIVEEFFDEITPKQVSFRELWEGYMMYGEDPFITPEPEGCHFSAWDYAKEKCRHLASD